MLTSHFKRATNEFCGYALNGETLSREHVNGLVKTGQLIQRCRRLSEPSPSTYGHIVSLQRNGTRRFQ